jgi:peptidoglycan/LPS O-acetylase OafA/YrhL
MKNDAALAPAAPVVMVHAPRLAAIDGLRGVAILAVIYHHFLNQRLTGLFGAPGVVFHRLFFSAYAFFSNGWLGVNLFFVLSGFVLMEPYALERRRFESRADVFTFYRRRARRLLPLYYLCLFAAMLAADALAVDEPRFGYDVFSLVTFTYSFRDDMFMPWFNMALWSLAVEVWFSVLFPGLVVLWRRVGLGKLVVAALVFSLGVRFVATYRWNANAAYHLTWKDGIFARLDDFVVGMALSVWLARRRQVPGAVASAVAVVVGIVVVGIAAVGWDNVVFANLRFTSAAVLNDVVLAGIVLVVGGMLSTPPGWLRLAFGNRPLQLAGAMCYSLYLWHMIAVRRSEHWSLGGVFVYLGLVFAVSALTYRFVEFPERSARSLFLGFPRVTDAAWGLVQKRGNLAPPPARIETVSELRGPT